MSVRVILTFMPARREDIIFGVLVADTLPGVLKSDIIIDNSTSILVYAGGQILIIASSA